MKAIKIEPFAPRGEISARPSKSAGHRMTICAALAGKGAQAVRPGDSEDIEATVRALNALGFSVSKADENAVAQGRIERAAPRVVDCGESGSTLRFLLPLALDGIETRFTGRGRLLERPMEVYEAICREQGIEYALERTSDGSICAIRVCGVLEPGRFEVAGNVSSQFITGLMLALFSKKGDSEIVLTSPLESKGYVDMTVSALSRFGTVIKETDAGYVIPGRQSLRACSAIVEGDWSHAAFFLTAGAMGGDIAVTGLDAESAQGDRAIVEVLARMGADVRRQKDRVSAVSSAMHGTVIDASQIPDLVPILSVAACAAAGETRIINAERLRIKESDRLAAMCGELSKLGADIKETSDGLIINGTGRLRGGAAYSRNDHRVAMSMAMAAIISDEPVYITDYMAVRKSAPGFYDEIRSLGANAEEVEI